MSNLLHNQRGKQHLHVTRELYNSSPPTLDLKHLSHPVSDISVMKQQDMRSTIQQECIKSVGGGGGVKRTTQQLQYKVVVFLFVCFFLH